MSGTTPGGLPYPDPTDPLAEGADAIRELAEELDPRVADTGWINIPLASGYVVFNSEPPAYRRIGNRVEFRGAVSPSSGNFPVSSTFDFSTAGAVQVGFRPTGTVAGYSGGPAAASSGQVRCSGSGTLSMRTSAAAASYLLLSGFSYLL